MTWEVPGYVAEELLGFGASGEVWRARAAATGEVVALKRLRAGRDPTGHQRLRREAALLAAFQHPHVVRLHGVLSTPGGPVLVLDYADGGSLAGQVAARDPYPRAELFGLLVPVADALAAAHAVGLVHGDVSPGNILLDASGRALLADLGTARLVGEGGGTAYGTAGFIDPAVRVGGTPDAASDVYGLAAVAVYALTGSGAQSPAAQAGAALAEPLPDVLQRALNPDPAGRPTAAALAAGLAAGATSAGGPVVIGAVPDGLAAATALTHAVHDGGRPAASGTAAGPAPGRHRSAALRGRLTVRRRRIAVRSAAALLVVGAAAAAGLLWGGAAAQQAGGAAAAPPVGVAPAAAQSSWAGVWAGLDARRGRAFATADAMLLTEVYLPECPALAADLATVRSLAARHGYATGVSHWTSRVQAELVSAEAVTLVVVDRMPGYDIRDASGRVLAHSPPRGERTLRARLVRTQDGWRIAELVA
ncbi:MAG: serine/threonine-protein kinase [Pseudonocardiales bacterium]